MLEFYKLNPRLMERYQPFLNERSENEVEWAHINGWVYGQYVTSSIGTSLSKKVRYPEKPYYIEQDRLDEDGEAHVMTDADRFEAWAMAFNASRKDVVDGEFEDVTNNDSI